MTRTKVLVLAGALLAASFAAEAAEFKPMHTKGDDSERRTGLWVCPKLGGADSIVPLKTRVYATKESVTDGVALRVEYAKGSDGQITMENSPFPAGSAGITMYAKASDEITMTIKGRASFKITTEWRKIDIPWQQLGTSSAKPAIGWEFRMGMTTPAAKAGWYIVDRLGCEGPEFEADPGVGKTAGPDDTISTKEIVGSASVLAPTVKRLKAKQPFKIIAFGDSVTAAAQASRGNWGVKGPAVDAHLYFSHLARLLEQRYGYKGVTPVKNGYGGWTSEQAKRVMGKVFANASAEDVVMIEFGANDLGWANKTIDSWLGNMAAIVAEAKKKTTQIIVMSPTTGGKVPAQAAEITRRFTAFAKEQGVAYVDITRWSMYRGEKFAWAYLANGYHPDFMGHVMMAELMVPLLGGEHFDWPRYAAKK